MCYFLKSRLDAIAKKEKIICTNLGVKTEITKSKLILRKNLGTIFMFIWTSVQNVCRGIADSGQGFTSSWNKPPANARLLETLLLFESWITAIKFAFFGFQRGNFFRAFRWVNNSFCVPDNLPFHGDQFDQTDQVNVVWTSSLESVL